MSVLSREEYLARISARVGDDTSDEALAFVADMTDTFSALETASADNTNWKNKYEENDKEWREKYKARFFDGDAQQAATPVAPEENERMYSYDELFKVKERK